MTEGFIGKIYLYIQLVDSGILSDIFNFHCETIFSEIVALENVRHFVQALLC